MFDWRPLLRHFLDETDLREYEFGIVKHGYNLSVKHLGDVLAGNHDGQRGADPLVVKYFTSGRTVYSLLSDAGYHWNRVLLQALYANKRLKHKRSCSLDIRIGRKGPAKRSYDCLYKSCSGGAVQVLFAPECDERDEDGFASAQREYLEAICEAIRRYRNEVLTIFCIPSRSRKTDRILREYLDSMTFIEIKENDLADTGAFIEAGRGDLVGKYVGWTAKIIQKKFKDAVGGVLFIDEAYSLLDDRNGSFGDEAINTIVQELENHREDVITIFAGYPEQMDEFMERNPGLRSRIAFHVDFPDYDPSELCDIAALTARKMGLEMSGEAIHKLYGVFDVARMNDNFGNGRFVRNVVERARMKQMKRLLENGWDAIARDSINTIEACDIEIPMMKEKEQVRIGFCG